MLLRKPLTIRGKKGDVPGTLGVLHGVGVIGAGYGPSRTNAVFLDKLINDRGPHRRLRCELIGVTHDIHSVLGSRKSDIDSVGGLEKANRGRSCDVRLRIAGVSDE